MFLQTGEKPFVCKQCNYSCTIAGSLKRHMLIHSGEKSFNCTQCSYSCAQAESLKKHMFIHSGEKPFRCEQYNYSCTQGGGVRPNWNMFHFVFLFFYFAPFSNVNICMKFMLVPTAQSWHKNFIEDFFTFCANFNNHLKNTPNQNKFHLWSFESTSVSSPSLTSFVSTASSSTSTSSLRNSHIYSFSIFCNL